MDRQIIINADDFGLCSGVNKAVAQGHTEGVLTSATIMSNMPAATEAVDIAMQLPALGVGVHLNLSEGQPVSKDSCVACLLDAAGRFALSPFKLPLLSIVSHKFRNAIRAELSAQIQWVIDKGLKPTHLDSHYHFHCLPPIFPIVCELARRFEIGAIRWPFEPKELSQTPWPLPRQGGRINAARLRIMAKINRLQNPGLLKTDAFLGIAHGGKIDTNFFKAVTLYSSAKIFEVMVHPGFADGLTDHQVQWRKIELDALCSEITKQHLKDAGIKLVHYGQL